MADPEFSLDKDGTAPLWIQLRAQIVQKIRSGEIEQGQKMPTVRGLAEGLSVSPSVVNQCYRYLRAVGYLESKQGSGIRVRRRTDNVDDADFAKAAKLINDFIDAYTALGMPMEGVIDAVSYAVAARNLDPDGQYPILDLYADVTGESSES